MSKVVEELKPKEWTVEEARLSGHKAYFIGVLLSGNPFKNGAYLNGAYLPLADEWIKGWNNAQESDPWAKLKKVNYAEERPDNGRSRSRDSSRDSASRPTHSGGRRR